MTGSKVVAEITALNEPFFAGTRDGELKLQQCDVCQTWRYPPAMNCPSCLSTERTWRAVFGRGTIWSWIVMHRRYLAGFDGEIPYAVGLVRLDEGPLVLARLMGDDITSWRCDQRVRVDFEQLSDEITVPFFRAIEEEP